MLEVVALAATVVGKFLVPLFTKGKEKLTEELAESGSTAVAGGLVGTATKLWDKITSRFDRDDEKSAVGLFEKNPAAMEAMLQDLLLQRIEADTEFRQQLSDLVEAPVDGTGKTSWQLMGDYVGAVDARGATISGGTVAGVIVSSPMSTVSPPMPSTPPTPSQPEGTSGT